jgi:uncharacterized membrane protein YccC
LKPGQPGADLAQAVNDSWFTAAGQANRSRIYTALETLDRDIRDLDLAFEEAKGQPPKVRGEIFKQQFARAEELVVATAEYKGLAEEADAFRVQAELEKLQGLRARLREAQKATTPAVPDEPPPTKPAPP